MPDTKILQIKPSLRKAADILKEARKGMGLKNFPFESKLSMRPLIEKCLLDYQHQGQHMQGLYHSIKTYTEENPSILESYPTVSALVKEHQDMVFFLFSSIFPAALSGSTYGYAGPPFALEPFYLTSGLENLLTDKSVKLKFEQFSEFDKVSYTVRACLIILEKYYHIKIDHVLPFLFSLNQQDTNLIKFYKATSLLDFIEVKVRSIPPDIPSEKLDFLLKNLNDSSLWLEFFPPDVFYFEGFFVAFMSDVTEVETLSRLRKLLLTSDSFLDYDTAKMVADFTRNYLDHPHVQVGIFAVDYPFEKASIYRYPVQYALVEEIPLLLTSQKEDNIYEKACRQNKIQIISDLKTSRSDTFVERHFSERGFRSLMIVPLRDHKKKIIGIMELASPEPYAFAHVKKLKLKEILPLYDVALEESRNAVENRIQNIIQEQFTNIHPCVFWKFSEVANNYLRRQEDPESRSNIEEIRFRDVYPLFGQIDIVSSTAIRNQSVQTDLHKNLRLISEVLKKSYEKTQFYLLRKFWVEVEKYLVQVDQQFESHLEIMINDLLVREIHPVLREIGDQHPDLITTIQEYFGLLDQTTDLIFESRKDFDISIRKVNGLISGYLEQQERINQKITPHYFEKIQTDGLEYTIYVGQSLLQRDHFSIHQLHNLRLWQLRSMIELHKRLEILRKKLPVEMTVSFLILAFNSPLNIIFRMEEKRFDVDGSYHARYQIIKKRIDKARLAGSTERLTQSGRLAIVYLQEKEREEYLEYLRFLAGENLLDPDIEELEVERVQDIGGVRALRVRFAKENEV